MNPRAYRRIRARLAEDIAGPHSHVANIADLAHVNPYFRRVVHTGELSQLVVMSIPPGDDIGTETHAHVEQTITVVEGNAVAVLDGVAVTLSPGTLLTVLPGVEHNVQNVGGVALKLYTIYAPPNHIDGRTHRTKADAEADDEDEAFGAEVQ